MQPFNTINELTEDKLLELVKRSASRIGSTHIELGKALFALEQRRPSEGTLKSFVKKKTGMDIPDHAFCCAVAFRLVGDGYSFIDESVYDKTPLRWLLRVSAIVNLLEKRILSEDSKAGTREEVCVILRNAPANGCSQLDKIKRDLQPVKEPTAEASEKETEAGTGDAAADASSVPVDPLSIEVFKAIGHAAFACEDVDKLVFAYKALKPILQIVVAKIEQIDPSRLEDLEPATNQPEVALAA